MESYRGVSIVYEDNHLLVVVKPPNMPTQADDSGDADLHSTMKAYIAETYQKPGAVYLGLVHRLDRPVGGLVVLAKTSKAADRLSAQVRDKTMHRQYVAAVRGDAGDAAELCDFLLKAAVQSLQGFVLCLGQFAQALVFRFEILAFRGFAHGTENLVVVPGLGDITIDFPFVDR